MNIFTLYDINMNVLKSQLVRARSRIENPENWTSGAAFKNKEGQFSLYIRPDVFSYSASGACAAEGIECNMSNNFFHALTELEIPLYDYNDSHTHAEVLALFDTAIGNCHKHYNVLR